MFGELENDNAVVLIKTYFCIYVLNKEFDDSERINKYLDALRVYLNTYKDLSFAQSVASLISNEA